MIPLSHLRNQDWHTITTWRPCSIQTFLVLPSVPSSAPGSHITLSWRISFASLGCNCFSDLLFFHDLDSFEEDWSGILGNVPQLGLSVVFLIVRPGLCVLGRRPQRWSTISITLLLIKYLKAQCIKDSCCHHDFPLVMLTLTPWLGKGLSGFCTVMSLSPFPYCTLWKEVLCTVHTPGVGIMLHLLEGGAST